MWRLRARWCLIDGPSRRLGNGSFLPISLPDLIGFRRSDEHSFHYQSEMTVIVTTATQRESRSNAARVVLWKSDHRRFVPAT